jgi:SNF2 family DNA or RNA helicase
MIKTKLIAGDYKIPAVIEDSGNGRLVVSFKYNKRLIEEIKAFEGAKWNPEKKNWSIAKSQRNQFQLDYLEGRNPYSRFDRPLVEYESTRPLMTHQYDLVKHILTVHWGIWAAEMGTGKSLAAIEAIEASGFHDWWWVAPKSALRSVELELEKWRSLIRPKLLTYEGLKKAISNWTAGKKAPHGVVFDESSRAKNPNAQRSQAARELADGVRNDWGDDSYILLMSGSPAPKSPADWWHQCEIACPGFLREGNIEKFKKRLGLIVQKESIQGGVYPHLITWLDDERKCKICGQFDTDPCHNVDALVEGIAAEYHPFAAAPNEVRYLYERMKGLVVVKFKKDCLDLPEKRYEIIRLKPSPQTLRAASLITARSSTVIGAMTLLRELSDGFQYFDEPSGMDVCNVCHGDCKITQPMPIIDHEELEKRLDRYKEALKDEAIRTGEYQVNGDDILPDALFDEHGSFIPDHILIPTAYENREVSCPNCGGKGQVQKYTRGITQVPCPKEDALKDLLDIHDDVGRLVVYAGFSGSIDRCVDTCRRTNWDVIRVDGRGWWSSIGDSPRALEMLRIFQAGTSENHPRVAFIGQPGAAGMGLTLTASPSIVYYSNDFNAESRIQSEDRIHRAGMDKNRGATIYDLIHLPTDEKVLDSLKKKRQLQAISLGELKLALGDIDITAERKL